MSLDIWQRRILDLTAEVSRFKRIHRTLHEILDLVRVQWINHHKCTCDECIRAGQRLNAAWMTTKPVHPDA